jgi:hypothetical protein
MKTLLYLPRKNNHLLIVIGLVFLYLPGFAQFQGARTITERKYPGCIELSNDSVRVVLEPNLGGRVLAYERYGKNVLYVDDAQDGLIYEGKNRHPSAGRCDFGPEKTVPPHPLLYLGKWQARITGDREAEMISQKDSATGVQLIRRFRLAKSGNRLEFTQVIKNTSNSSKSYCHWSRTFVKGGGISLAPLNPHSRYPRKYILYGPGNIMNFMPEIEESIRIREGILEILAPPSQPKFVTDTEQGWLAYITLDNQLFIKKYPVYPLRIYGEMAASTACVYYKPLYCEIEPIGPMETIAPGKESAFTEYWYLFDYQYPADKKANLKELLTRINELRSPNSEQ